jgi:parvulin-like peptidyl-prolyl isomerase
MSVALPVDLPAETLLALLRRMELLPQLLRRQEEEAITALVPLPSDWLDEQRQAFVADQPLEMVLASRSWSEADLDLHLARPEALRRFAQQRFGPGLEEHFLSAQGGHDQIVYSLLRVREAALAQELWIRLEEGETTFAEAASAYSEGPEAARKGVIGPMPIGQLHPPELAIWLRSLQPGSLHPPRQLGDWFVLLRLEQLTPARFDGPMREFLLNQQLDSYLQDRVRRRLEGEELEPLHYDPEP